MPKRINRCAPIAHHIEQLETLKTLEPIATPDKWRAFSDALVDASITSLKIVQRLESGRPFSRHQYNELIETVSGLRALIPGIEDG
jgi:hypothetical protein